jgi:hypothetical protein
MGLGIALMVLGVLGTTCLAGALGLASSWGAVELGALGTLDPRAAAVLAAMAAVAATSLLYGGIALILRARARGAQAVRLDERARQAEEEARARLLELRLEQLHKEVELLESRRATEAGEPPTPPEGSEVAGVAELILLPDPDGTPELARRLASAPRRRGRQG